MLRALDETLTIFVFFLIGVSQCGLPICSSHSTTLTRAWVCSWKHGCPRPMPSSARVVQAAFKREIAIACTRGGSFCHWTNNR